MDNIAPGRVVRLGYVRLGKVRFGLVLCKEEFYDFPAVGLFSLGLSSLGLFSWHHP